LAASAAGAGADLEAREAHELAGAAGAAGFLACSSFLWSFLCSSFLAGLPSGAAAAALEGCSAWGVRATPPGTKTGASLCSFFVASVLAAPLGVGVPLISGDAGGAATGSAAGEGAGEKDGTNSATFGLKTKGLASALRGIVPALPALVLPGPATRHALSTSAPLSLPLATAPSPATSTRDAGSRT